MRAGEREFRHRFWFIFGLFWLAFGCYAIDRQNTALWLAHIASPSLDAASSRRAFQLVLGFGALLGFAAAWIRTWGTAYLSRQVVHADTVQTGELVADGPYRHVRHPLYFGNQLLMFGVALGVSRLGALVLIVGGFVLHLRLIGREEAGLIAARGDAFRAYCARVPKFIPSLLPRIPAAGRAPRWGEAFLSESFLWTVGIAMVVYAITLRARVLVIASLGGLVIYGTLRPYVRRWLSRHEETANRS